MKKLYIILFAFSFSTAQAQISDAWKNEIESIFQHVNRTPVTTGLLTDYGIYFTNTPRTGASLPVSVRASARLVPYHFNDG